MWDSMKSLLGGDKKLGSKKGSGEVYTAANSDAILSQQKWLADAEVESEEPKANALAPAAEPKETVESLQKQLAERDATLADMLMEHLIIQRTFQAELADSEGGLGLLSTRVSTLEAVRYSHPSPRFPRLRTLVRVNDPP